MSIFSSLAVLLAQWLTCCEMSVRATKTKQTPFERNVPSRIHAATLLKAVAFFLFSFYLILSCKLFCDRCVTLDSKKENIHYHASTHPARSPERFKVRNGRVWVRVPKTDGGTCANKLYTTSNATVRCCNFVSPDQQQHFSRKFLPLSKSVLYCLLFFCAQTSQTKPQKNHLFRPESIDNYDN